MTLKDSSIALEQDLEQLDALLADTLWTAVVDRTTPFEVMMARAVDVFDAFLSIARQVREGSDAEWETTGSSIDSNPGDRAAPHARMDAAVADRVFDRLATLKLRVASLRWRLDTEQGLAPSFLRLRLAEIDCDTDAAASLLRQELAPCISPLASLSATDGTQSADGITQYPPNKSRAGDR
jgi:hypothetical protein